MEIYIDPQTELLQAIQGYGCVVGLPSSNSDHLLGSLPKITRLLASYENNQDPQLVSFALQALKTLTAINQRESINGTEIERRDPDRFSYLTLVAQEELATLRGMILCSTE